MQAGQVAVLCGAWRPSSGASARLADHALWKLVTASCTPALRHPSPPPRSRRCKTLIAEAFERSVDGGAASPLLNSRLHDFGFRCGARVDGMWRGGGHQAAAAPSRACLGALAWAVWHRPACGAGCSSSTAPMAGPLLALHASHALLSVPVKLPRRGCTCVEQSVLGGVAHLLSFEGSGEAGERWMSRGCPGVAH